MTPTTGRRNTWESREGTSVANAPADAPEAPEGAGSAAPDETAASTRVELMWPNKDLSANARVHWARRASQAKRARANAVFLARYYGLKHLNADAISASITFHPPDNRRRDLDGMLSSLKSALDGLADVIGVDDSRWEIAIRKAEPRPPHGAVVVEISVPA